MRRRQAQHASVRLVGSAHCRIQELRNMSACGCGEESGHEKVRQKRSVGSTVDEWAEEWVVCKS